MTTVERDWMDQGTRVFLATVAGIDDDELRAPSLLPGWTRAHVVAHVHHNADGLRRLVGWAATGVEARMYPSRAARDEEIEVSAALAPGELRAAVHSSAGALEQAFDALTDEGWARQVTGPGGPMTASTLAYLRAQETFVHAVDLDAGVSFDDLPRAFLARFVERVAAHRAAEDVGPALAAWLSGRSQTPPSLGPWR